MKTIRWSAALLFLCSLAMAASAQSTASASAPDAVPANLVNQLDEIARVASVMIDGDVCEHIVTPRAMKYVEGKIKVPGDKWAAGDNYDVNYANFDRVKKTTMRLALLAPFPVDVDLWMPVPTDPPQIQMVVRNHYDMSQFWKFGAMGQEMFPEMAEVLKTGKPVTVRDRRPGLISVLAPVRNSLGKIVGLVEVAASTAPHKLTDQ
jgi:hypothetical protein